MKVTQLINSVSLSVREITNFVRYPAENVSRIVTRRLQRKYEEVEIPFGKKQEAKAKTPVPDTTLGREIREENGAYVPSSNGAIAQTVTPRFAPKQSRQAVIPPLQKNNDIQGRKGRYRITSDRPVKEVERARFYEGIQLPNNKPILIKEYLLPAAHFNQQEARQRKEEFEQIASVNLKNGGGQDFRLLGFWEAIAPRDERRCYLITEQIDNSVTLREYLEQTNRPMTSKQVREVLNQVLQTLWFLHNQRVRFPNGEVRTGLPHGNLTLDSLLIATNHQQSLIDADEEQFFIYLCDLALWENLFKPLTSKPVSPSPEKDLKDLGYLSFYLLSGGDTHPVYGQRPDPKNEQNWMKIDNSLKLFIRHLLGLDLPFTNADHARQALAAVPEQEIEKQVEKTIEAEKKTRVNSAKINASQIFLLLIFLAIGLTGVFYWKTILAQIPEMSAPISNSKYSKISEVSNVASCTSKDASAKSEGTFNYLMTQLSIGSHHKKIDNGKNAPGCTFKFTSAKSQGTWNYLMTQPSLVSPGKTFGQELSDRDMKLKLSYEGANSLDEVIKKVQAKKADFFITQLVDENNFKEQLTKNNLNHQKIAPIAYDGILVFVPFSDSQREGSISQALNGKITFEQLRRLYIGEITNWKQIDNKLPDLPVKLYIPLEEEVVNRFQELVFKNDSDQIKKFDQLINAGKITRLETRQTLGTKILGDFENGKNGGIGFGILSNVYGQCSVYPLSVGEQGHEVQPLVQNNGKDINPKTNLCNDKGNYHPNVDAFAQKLYPFGYTIAVVYPDVQSLTQQAENNFAEIIKSQQAGRNFADILKTEEGQNLLSEAGLVPISNLDK